MNPRPRSNTPAAGGFLLAIAVLVGTVAGALRGEPSLGFVAGAGIGAVLAATVWLLDRRRKG